MELPRDTKFAFSPDILFWPTMAHFVNNLPCSTIFPVIQWRTLSYLGAQWNLTYPWDKKTEWELLNIRCRFRFTNYGLLIFYDGRPMPYYLIHSEALKHLLATMQAAGGIGCLLIARSRLQFMWTLQWRFHPLPCLGNVAIVIDSMVC